MSYLPNLYSVCKIKHILEYELVKLWCRVALNIDIFDYLLSKFIEEM